MLIISLLSSIFSNAVATSKKVAILYSRSVFITYFFSMIFISCTFDLHFFEKSKSIFNGLIYVNLTNLVFVFFLFLLGFFILVLTSFYPCDFISSLVHSFYGKRSDFGSKKFNLKEHLQIKRDHYEFIEYSLIIQFILIGSVTLLSSNDLITIFLSIELQSYGLYIISTIYRNSEASTGAGLTYFLLGGLSSCIILLGQSFLYVNSGLTNLDGLYLIQNIITSDNNLLSYFFIIHEKLVNTVVHYSPIFTSNFHQYTLQFSFIVLIVGFLFKISAAPFHSWSPGVYDAIPTVTTTFVAIVPKISILILFFDLVYYTWYTTFDYSWTSVLLFSSFLSLIIGSVLGLTQFKIKRLYAYSTISHVGFILLALCIHSIESMQAFFFYIIQYSLSNVNAFFILIFIGYTQVYYWNRTEVYNSILSYYNSYNKKLKDLSPIEYIDTLKGYFYLNPIVAISFSITLYSFIGVPPLVGFFAKQMILSSALDKGNIFMCLIAISTSVVSAVYYLYIIKDMFFEESKTIDYTFTIQNNKSFIKQSNEDLTQNNENLVNKHLESMKEMITPSNWLTCVISLLTWLILLFIFLYYEIYYLTNIIGIQIIY